MKFFWPALFIGSLAFNAGLAWIMLSGAQASSARDPAGAAHSTKALAASAPELPPLDASIWPQLKSDDDLPTLIARLKARGFPSDMIRSVINALVDEKYAARRKALDPADGTGNRPYWKIDRPPDPKVVRELAELTRQKLQELRALLGPNYNGVDPVTELSRRHQLSFLPAGKAAQVQELTDRYSALQTDIYIGGTLLPADRVKIADLDKEKRAALAQLLSLDEFEAYELRNSRTATTLRGRIGLFEPTEEEFRTLYQLRKPFDEQFTGNGLPPTDDWVKQRAAAEQVLQEKMKAALGAERYADYERSADYNYRATAQLVARLNLPPASASEAWSVQKDIQKRVAALRGDEALPESQRNAQLSALADEAAQRLSSTLGPRGLAEYRRNSGWWLRDIAPPPSVSKE
jgi:hypothetical protein